MKQLVLSKTLKKGETIVLSGSEYRYLARVRRVKKQQTISGIDPSGNKYLLKIVDLQEQNLTMTVESMEKHPEAKNPEMTLFQCLPKGKKMDQIIRQSVEAGISRIIPVISTHTISRPDGTEKKHSRWEKIAKETVQQCGRADIPRILPVIPFSEIHTFLYKNSINFFCHEKPLEKAGLHSYLFRNDGAISLLVGPEGGLHNTEVEYLLNQRCKPLYLGDTVLRTETASLFAIGAIRVTILENNQWKIP